MLAKGHNFEKVNLVVVLGIDGLLNFPDFRAVERVYQLLTQISGRAGRYSQKGKVVVQTLNPDHPLFDFVKNHSFDDYYKSEFKIRQSCQCPPYTYLIALYFTGKTQSTVIETSQRAIRQAFKLRSPGTEAIGPRPAFIEKKVDQFTWMMLLRSKNRPQLRSFFDQFKESFSPPWNVAMKVVVDPSMID